MTDFPEDRRQLALAQQVRRLGRKKAKNPVTAVLTALLNSNARDARQVQVLAEELLLARQVLETALETVLKNAELNAAVKDVTRKAHALHKALNLTRHALEWIKREGQAVIESDYRSAFREIQREPELLADTILKGLLPRWLGLIRKTPGTWCPLCEQEIRE